jgi:hypothetical protein
VVDSSDFTLLAANFNQAGATWASGDFNGDGVVNALDFNALASHFGQSTPAPALGSLVPEPLTALPLTGLLLARRRRVR